MMNGRMLTGAIALTVCLGGGGAQAATAVGIGISGWTGFGPLTLAKEAGIFERNGVDVTIKKIPQKDRHLALLSGDIQCAATTVETWLIWNASGVETQQVVQLDKSYGADGMVVRNDVASIKDLKGKTVAASAPGTAPYFTLAWFLKENGLAMDDVTIVNLEPAAAAQAFIAGRNDAAMTYEPYLSAVRNNPEAGKIIATTLDYPMVMDTFGCTKSFIEQNPQTVQAMVTSYFDAPRHDQGTAGKGVRDHGCRREANGGRVPAIRFPPPLAGSRGQQGLFQRLPSKSSPPKRATCCLNSASSRTSPRSRR